MSLKKDFQKLLKKNRKKVLDAGFKPAAVTHWTYGKRIPMFENAIKLSMILDIPISKVPYRKVEINQ